MDNIDSLCDTMEKWNSLCDFVKEVCNIMYTEEDCQVGEDCQVCLMSILTHISPASRKWDIGKQCRPRSDAVECSV